MFTGFRGTLNNRWGYEIIGDWFYFVRRVAGQSNIQDVALKIDQAIVLLI